jgi:hypothetical protein
MSSTNATNSKTVDLEPPDPWLHYYCTAVLISADGQRIQNPWLLIQARRTVPLTRDVVHQQFMLKFPQYADRPSYLINVLEISKHRYDEIEVTPDTAGSLDGFIIHHMPHQETTTSETSF